MAHRGGGGGRDRHGEGGGSAHRLAKIFGTEEDTINCPFYYKIGACRHGDRCSRNHVKPHFSMTLLVPKMYTPPTPDPQTGVLPDPHEHFEDFYEEVLDELKQFGSVEDMVVVENLGEHMNGNTYIKVGCCRACTRLFNFGSRSAFLCCERIFIPVSISQFGSEDEAQKALIGLKDRFYAGVLLQPEYSPVTDFRDARCRQHDEVSFGIALFSTQSRLL